MHRCEVYVLCMCLCVCVCGGGGGGGGGDVSDIKAETFLNIRMKGAYRCKSMCMYVKPHYSGRHLRKAKDK